MIGNRCICKVNVLLSLIDDSLKKVASLKDKGIDVREIVQALQNPVIKYCAGNRDTICKKNENFCQKAIKLNKKEELSVKEQVKEMIRTYLTVVIGNAELIMQQTNINKEQIRKMTKDIHGAAWKIGDILQKQL